MVIVWKCDVASALKHPASVAPAGAEGGEEESRGSEARENDGAFVLSSSSVPNPALRPHTHAQREYPRRRRVLIQSHAAPIDSPFMASPGCSISFSSVHGLGERARADSPFDTPRLKLKPPGE